MATTIKARKAKPANVAAARLAILNGMRAIGKDIKRDFEATTATWDHKPDFKLDISLAGGEPAVTVGTTDKIYGYVDEGTRPHTIAPVNAKVLSFQAGYKAKTQPGVIGSTGGGAQGDQVFSMVVNHPGTKARNFSQKIKRKWAGEFGKRMVQAMAEAAKATGHGR